MAALSTTKPLLVGVNLLSKFRGALIAAVAGDCIGANFEGLDLSEIQINDIEKLCSSLNGDKAKMVALPFTDDTAMARSVADSLLKKNGLDVHDMAKRFTEEFLREPNRGYGGEVCKVFRKLHEDDYKEPFGPASRQFDGTGSYGNGAAMRIAPAALFAYDHEPKDLHSLVEGISKITHTHHEALIGAKLQCYAVQQALRIDPGTQLDTKQFLAKLIHEAESLEASDSSDVPEKRQKMNLKSEKRSYTFKLGEIEKLLEDDSPRTIIDQVLGTNISAIGSVPAAIFCFLKSSSSIKDIKADGPVERTIKYAISLGGDTDTIASMAGAISGACYGMEAIPEVWTKSSVCEGADKALDQATSLYNLHQ